MPYSPPSGSAAHFTATGTLSFPRPYNGLTFKFPAGTYTAETGDDIDAQFPAVVGDGYTPPAGSAANFTEASSMTPTGEGAVTVGVVAQGFGEIPLPSGVGEGNVIVPITPAGSAAHGVGGVGSVSIGATPSGSGARGVAGTGGASVGISCGGTGIVERYELRGEVRLQGVLVDRRVRAYRRDTGALVGEGDTVAGRFRLHVGFAEREHYVIPINTAADADDFAPPCANRVLSVLAQDAA